MTTRIQGLSDTTSSTPRATDTTAEFVLYKQLCLTQNYALFVHPEIGYDAWQLDRLGWRLFERYQFCDDNR